MVGEGARRRRQWHCLEEAACISRFSCEFKGTGEISRLQFSNHIEWASPTIMQGVAACLKGQI